MTTGNTLKNNNEGKPGAEKTSRFRNLFFGGRKERDLALVAADDYRCLMGRCAKDVPRGDIAVDAEKSFRKEFPSFGKPEGKRRKSGLAVKIAVPAIALSIAYFALFPSKNQQAPLFVAKQEVSQSTGKSPSTLAYRYGLGPEQMACITAVKNRLGNPKVDESVILAELSSRLYMVSGHYLELYVDQNFELGKNSYLYGIFKNFKGSAGREMENRIFDAMLLCPAVSSGN